MALPKAVLCLLGDQNPAHAPEEAMLRASGFATATLHWDEVASQKRGWMQLLPVIDDPAVQAWVFSGRPADFTEALLCRIGLLTLALTRPAPPLTAFVLTGSGEAPAMTDFLGHIRIFHGNATFAAKLAAVRRKPRFAPQLPFHARAHANPLIGLWLEAGPPPGQSWEGFMAGVVGAEVVAFGVGPRGALPEKSVLHFPLCGIKGEMGEKEFSACAAKNEVDGETACYLRVEGSPRVLFITAYPSDDDGAAEERPVQALEIV